MNSSINPATAVLENLVRLPLEINRRGATYDLIQRGRKSVIYSRTVPNQDVTYEVFLVKVRKESIINGKLVPAGEIFPGDEAFGKTAWAPWTLERAMDKFNFLESCNKP